MGDILIFCFIFHINFINVSIKNNNIKCLFYNFGFIFQIYKLFYQLL